VPLSPAAQAWLAREPETIATLVSGGDDYEILATVPENRRAAFAAAARADGVAVAVIGRVVSGQGPVRLIGAGSREIALKQQSYSHFR
ncbi:MAG: thiamine-phosphate kinase, partial [Xanthobacteraceae bacterium]